MQHLAKPGEFCPNPDCPDYQKRQTPEHPANIIRAGRTRKGVQRYWCKTCGKYFVQTTGTIFYRKRTPQEQILRVLALAH